MCAVGVPCAGLEVLDPRLSPYTNNPCLGYAGATGGGATNQISDGYLCVQERGKGSNVTRGLIVPSLPPVSHFTRCLHPLTPFPPTRSWFHHTAADTIDRVDPNQLNLLAASLAIWAVAVADLPELLPRSGTVPDLPSGGGGGGDGSGTAGKVAAGVGITAVALVAVAAVLYRRRLAAWFAQLRGARHQHGAVVATSASHGGGAESYEQLSAPLGHGGGGHSTTI
jgi:hypothetical protein